MPEGRAGWRAVPQHWGDKVWSEGRPRPGLYVLNFICWNPAPNRTLWDKGPSVGKVARGRAACVGWEQSSSDAQRVPP